MAFDLMKITSRWSQFTDGLRGNRTYKSWLRQHSLITVLTSESELEIGRKSPAPCTIGVQRCEFRLPVLSTKHARLGIDGLGIYLMDVGTRGFGSTNGTFVNGQRLQPGRKYRLNAEDSVWFGPPDKLTSLKLTWKKTRNNQYVISLFGLTPRDFDRRCAS